MLKAATESLHASLTAVNRRSDGAALEAPFAGYKNSGKGQPAGGT